MTFKTAPKFLRRLVEKCNYPKVEGAGSWFSGGRFALILAVFLFGSFTPVFLGQQTFYFRDFSYFGYPFAFHVKEAFLSGEIPLWNPYSNFGIPFHAQWNTLVFYPLSLFYILLPLPWSVGVFCLLHLYLGGLGMYWLARRWTGNGLAASFSGLAFAANGFVISCVFAPNYVATMGWMPWVVVSMSRGSPRGILGIIFAGVCSGMQLLAGTPEFVLSTWVLVGAIFLGEAVEEKAWIRRALRLAISIILGCGLAAVQIFPFLRFLLLSHRDGTYDFFWSLPKAGLLNFIVPLFGTEPNLAGVFVRSDLGTFTSYYAGISVLVFAVFACFARPRPATIALGLLTGISLILALGDNTPLLPWLKQQFPMFGFMRYPIKFVAPLSVTLPLLAAIGFSGMFKAPSKIPNKGVLLCGGGFVVIALLVCAFNSSFPLPGELVNAVWVNGLSRMAFLAATLGACWFLSHRERLPFSSSNASGMTKNAVVKKLAGGSILLLLWLDLATHTPVINPTVSPEIYTTRLSRIHSLRPLPKIGELRLMQLPVSVDQVNHGSLPDPLNTVLIQRLSQFHNINLLDHIPKVFGYYALYLNEEHDFWPIAFSSNSSYYPQIADFLSVSQVSRPDEPFNFESRSSYLPMATVGQEALFLNPSSIPQRMQSSEWNPRETVFLDETQSDKLASPISRQIDAKVNCIEWKGTQITLDVESPGPTIVVLSQAYYPEWKAYVSEVVTPIIRANYAFQAIEVPAGTHRLILKYEDKYFALGAAVSVLCVSISLICFLRFAVL